MDLTSSEFKEIAREALKGKWIQAVSTMVVSALMGAFSASIVFMAAFVFFAGLGIRLFEGAPHYFFLLIVMGSLLATFYFFAGGVARFGYINYNLALLDRRKTRISMAFGRTSHFWQAIYMRIALFFYELFFTILLIVPGIIKSYSYAMVPYILEEKPGFTARQAMKISTRMMRGHKWQLFCLRFSFIGWYILCILTAGLGLLFVIPYKNVAEAVFYNEISGRADVLYGRNKE
ncbi:MAG: DUF975 family protein [Clostridiales bacterium]|nr:DUF975 family protein [Clostridiales bacterium]